MKTETSPYSNASGRRTLEPRYVIGLSFDDDDTDITYLTSHADAFVPVGTAGIDRIDGAIQSISGLTQKISPDKATHSIGNISFHLVDVNGELTTKINTKLNGGEGLRKKQITLYKGHEELTTWDDYAERLTYIVDDVKFHDGVYKLSASDIQRSEKEDIFTLDQAVLTSTITDTATQIPITVANASEKFQTVEHDADYGSNPSATVGYIKIDDEIICHSGWDAGFTYVTVVERGALNTRPAAHVVGETTTAIKKKINEYIYLEMAAPKLLYAILTGILHGQAGKTLPDRWHLAIPSKYVKLTDIETIDYDLWNPTTGTGKRVRFMGLSETSGKSFIESELLTWMGCFMPVYSDGSLGLKKLEPVTPYSAYQAYLTEDDVISYSELRYDQSAVLNNLAVYWNYLDSIEHFSKVSQLVDSESISKHGKAPLVKYELKGVFVGMNSDQDVADFFRVIRDRYGNPPMTMTIKVLPRWDILDVGDIIRLSLPQVTDYNSDATLDRSFEIQNVKTDWVTGVVTLTLFGGIEKATSNAVSGSNVMQDSFYTSEGSALSSHVTIVGNAMTASGSVTGGSDLTAGANIVYHNGDLTINNGVTLTINRNVQLRVKGFLTVNGNINVDGNTSDAGYIGTTNSGFAALMIIPWFSFTSPNGSDNRRSAGKNSVPTFALKNPDGLSLTGLTTKLNGEYGADGKDAYVYGASQADQAVPGGSGGAGGGGLAIICRGMAMGLSANINTDGVDGTAGSRLLTGAQQADVYAHGQWGAGGYPGGVLVLIDGDYTTPTFSSSNFSAVVGNSGPPAGIDVYTYPGDYQKYTGDNDAEVYGQLISAPTDNKWRECSTIQFLPEPETPFDWYPEDELDESPPYGDPPVEWEDILDPGGTKPDDNANVAPTTYAQDAEPTVGLISGDIWIDTNDKNRMYRYNGSIFVVVRDTDIPVAVADATQALADAAQAAADAAVADGKATQAEIDALQALADAAAADAAAAAAQADATTAISNAAAAQTDADNAQITADGKIVTFYQTSMPSGSEGDLWIDTDDGNKLYRHNGTTFVAVQDGDISQALSDAATAQSTADGKIVSFYQDAMPGGGSEGDLWIDTNDGDKLYRHNGSTFVNVQDSDIATAISDAAFAQATADGKIVTFYQDAQPGGGSVGDLWIDTNNGNKIYRHNGSIWQDAEDTGIAQALSDSATAIADAATAQGTADGKVTTFVQTSTPTAEGVGDLWMDTDDGNKLYRWSGSAWVSYAQLSALWANVSGTGTPEDNATVGAQIGSDFLDVDGNLTVMDYYNADTIYENIPVHTLDIVNKSVGSGGVIGLSVATGSLYLATPSSGYAYATRYVTDARNTWAKKRGFSAELRINGTTTGFFGSSEFYLGHDVSYGYMGLYLGVNSSSQATWNYIFNVGATETYQGSIMGGNTYDMDGTPAGDKTFRIAAVWDPVANTASYSVTDGTDLYTFQKTGLTNNPPDNSHHYRMHADIGGSVWCGVPKWGFFQEV